MGLRIPGAAESTDLPAKMALRTARFRLSALELQGRKLKEIIATDTSLPEKADRPEMLANIQLAIRHIEDARMRYGKAIQAMEGGESIYADQAR